MSIKHVTKDVTYEAMSDDCIRIATTGDVHLLHPRVSTRIVLEHLESEFDDEYVKTLDTLVINGDLTDRRADLESGEFLEVLHWMVRFLRRLAKYNVQLIVLEGTRSHDHGQSEFFVAMNDWSQASVDITYVKNIDIVQVAGRFNALFIPDEVNHDASITQGQVKTLMSVRGVSEVDFAWLHGMFQYQLPIESIACHDAKFYQSVVKKRIVINHVHTPSSFGKIRAPGSLVRLKHGEEEVKGHHLIQVTGDTVSDWFIETQNNVVFKTIDVTGLTAEELQATLMQFSKDHSTGSHLRLRLTRRCPTYHSLREFKRQFPGLKIAEDFTDSSVTDLGQGDELLEVSQQPMELTNAVLRKAMADRVGELLNNDPLALNALNELLDEVF